MSDSKKSKKELLAELEALRSKLGVKQAKQDDPTEAKTSGITRRDVLSAAWVAPVILTVPLAGMAPKAQAQAPTVPTPFPSSIPEPTEMPTMMPTSRPTEMPTQPLQTPAPATSAPTAPVPTAFPTATPTVADVIPVELSDFDIR